MSIHIDRREIAPLLLPHFPEMEGASSDEWHAFLDQVTGLSTPLDEQNATAFDRWRQALATLDIPVWSITPAAAAAMKQRGEELARKAMTARIRGQMTDTRDQSPAAPPAFAGAGSHSDT